MSMIRAVMPDEIPYSPHANGDPFVADDIRKFLRTDNMEACEISYKGKNASNISNACRRYIKKHNLGSKLFLSQSSGHVYLRKFQQIK